MKTVLTLFFAFLFSAGFAQKIKVSESNANIGGGNNNALEVTLYSASVDQVEKAWKGEMKKMKGKITSKKGEYFVDDAEMKQMGENSFDLYARVEKEGDKDAKLIVAVDLGGAFMSSSAHAEQFKVMKGVIYDFAVETTKEIIGEEVKAQEKILADLEKDQKDLVKDNEKLHKDIEDYKKKIAEAEKAIEDNKKDQEKKKEEITAQQKAVQVVVDQQKAVK